MYEFQIKCRDSHKQVRAYLWVSAFNLLETKVVPIVCPVQHATVGLWTDANRIMSIQKFDDGRDVIFMFKV